VTAPDGSDGAAPGPVPVQRVVVTHPRTTAARRSGGSTARREIGAMTPVGTVFVRTLVRSQLRLSGAVLAGMVLVIGVLPIVGALLPGALSVRVLGVPLAWAFLACLVFPTLFGVGVWYVRHAERTEQRFIDLVERG